MAATPTPSHVSDHSFNLTHIHIRAHIPIILDTNQMNYQPWRELFETHCLTLSVLGHLDGTSLPTSPSDTRWFQTDGTIKMWIYGTISESLLNSVGKKNCSAHQLWTTIENLFNNNNCNSNSKWNWPNYQQWAITLIWYLFVFIFGFIVGFFMAIHALPCFFSPRGTAYCLAPTALTNAFNTLTIIHPNDSGRCMDSSHTVHLTAQQVSRPSQHQVFISFRGEQLRNNFISHLVDALRRKQIKVFTDKELNKGEAISHLFKRIEESRIAIVVFSSKYTESTWCLREAEKIKELAAQDKLKVLPIFYKVTTNDVKQLKGKFGDYFRDREREYRNDTFVIEKWKEALEFITDILGLKMNDQSDEIGFIASIVEEVMKMLKSIPLAAQSEESHITGPSWH